ncbi:MAG: phosphatidate cytidylyltransferase [Armatimonadota bacterium]|nr:MAG: phosphatidate cytidylyltransferase [Armatimonadota bacterium]
MLWQRALTAAVGIPVALLLIYLGGWYLAALVTALSLLGLREYYRLAAALGSRVRPLIGYLVALPITLTPAPYTLPPMLLLVCVWAAGELALMLRYVVRTKRLVGIENIGWRNATLLGLLYVAFLFGHVNLLRAFPGDDVSLPGLGPGIPFGAGLVALVVIACWATDTAAYFVGKAIGRHKLSPKISPGKTVEGAAAGLVAAVLTAASMGRWLGLPLVQGVLLGAILGVAGQLGDLFESSLKRRAGVKDSGALLPGHGGVLDRLDSLLFSAPAAYYYLCYVLGR